MSLHFNTNAEAVCQPHTGGDISLARATADSKNQAHLSAYLTGYYEGKPDGADYPRESSKHRLSTVEATSWLEGWLDSREISRQDLCHLFAEDEEHSLLNSLDLASKNQISAMSNQITHFIAAHKK